MQSLPTTGQQRTQSLYNINPRFQPLVTRLYSAGLLEHHITMENWDRYAQTFGHKNTEEFLASLPAGKATEWRTIIDDSLKEQEPEKPEYDERLRIMLISQELQEIVDKELPGYKVELEKSEK